MTPASQWCEMLSLFLPFKQQPVKRPQLNKGVSAQRTRVLGHSTLSVHLKMGGREQTEEVEPETQWRWRLRSQLTSYSSWAQSPENPGAGEEEVQTVRASQPPCDHSHRKMGSSEWQGPYFCPLSQRHPWRPLPAAAEPMNLTKPDTAEVPAPPSSLPPSPSPVVQEPTTQKILSLVEEPTVWSPSQWCQWHQQQQGTTDPSWREAQPW